MCQSPAKAFTTALLRAAQLRVIPEGQGITWTAVVDRPDLGFSVTVSSRSLGAGREWDYFEVTGTGFQAWTSFDCATVPAVSLRCQAGQLCLCPESSVLQSAQCTGQISGDAAAVASIAHIVSGCHDHRRCLRGALMHALRCVQVPAYRKPSPALVRLLEDDGVMGSHKSVAKLNKAPAAPVVRCIWLGLLLICLQTCHCQ
jgi:hypothetical protein